MRGDTILVDLNHGSGFRPGMPTTAPYSAAPSAALTAAVDAAVEAMARRDYRLARGDGDGGVAEKRIGASYIGTACDRELAYRYHRAPRQRREEFVSAGELARHAASGHWTEASMAAWLREAGFDLRTRRPDGRQYGYAAARGADGRAAIAGEIDGVILAAPEGIALPVPCIWESKKATRKKMNKFVKEGVAAADPVYHGQLQVNMAYLDVGHTLFSMLCLDDMRFHWELVALDPAVAQRLSDRAAAVVRTREPEEMPRIAAARDFHQCRLCDYQDRCWGNP